MTVTAEQVRDTEWRELINLRLNVGGFLLLWQSVAFPELIVTQRRRDRGLETRQFIRVGARCIESESAAAAAELLNAHRDDLEAAA